MNITEIGKIGNLTIKNRTVRSATWMNLATEDGLVTESLIQEYENYAKGDVGLIICEHMHVSSDGQGTPRELQIHSEKALPGLRRLTKAVHAAGGIIFAQLEHAGVHSRSYLTKQPAMGPSEMEGIAPNKGIKWHAQAMTETDIRQKINDFANAAWLAKEAGFDGVQIHAAHGYLISEFLLDFYNQRTDRWGNSLEGKFRFLENVYNKTRMLVGNDFPVITKINAIALKEGDKEYAEEFQALIRLVSDLGFDAIEISGGIIHYDAKNHPAKYRKKDQIKLPYYEEESKIAKEIAGNTPIILVGGIRSVEDIERILRDDIADFVSFSRPLIQDPFFIRKIMNRQKVSECISCNGCCKAENQKYGVKCIRKGAK